MKTKDKLKAKLQKAYTLSEKIAIRIETIKLNRQSNGMDLSIRPITDLLDRIQSGKNSQEKLNLK